MRYVLLVFMSVAVLGMAAPKKVEEFNSSKPAFVVEAITIDMEWLKAERERRKEEIKPAKSEVAAPFWRGVHKNSDRYNGWSLSGWRYTRAKLRVTVADPKNKDNKIVTTASYRPSDDTDTAEVEELKKKYDAEVVVEHAVSLKVGLVQLHDPSTWEEFNNYQQQISVIGIGIEIRF